jgi:hypothetical protein
LDLWASFNGVKLDFSRPRKPTDNAFKWPVGRGISADPHDRAGCGHAAGARRHASLLANHRQASHEYERIGERVSIFLNGKVW